ncbi:MAG: hypothetical protein ACI9IV_000935 [Paracoccaceae bacterium]|jgi:uncharacterized protein YqeY
MPDIKTRINVALKQAMRDKNTVQLSTLRLINAAIKDRDIALRGEASEASVTDAEVTQIMGRMVKQRRESARAYEEGGRLELAEQEQLEITVIEEFLPRKLTDEQVSKAIADAIEETAAASIRDMGKVMGVLKAKHTGQIDFGAVGPMVKDMLAG